MTERRFTKRGRHIYNRLIDKNKGSSGDVRVNEVKRKGDELCDDDEKVSQRVRKEKKV